MCSPERAWFLQEQFPTGAGDPRGALRFLWVLRAWFKPLGFGKTL